MHKGLYWSQLFLGMGIGLVISALIWVYVDGGEPQVKPEREIVYYDSTDFTLALPKLTIPEAMVASDSPEVPVVEPKIIDFVIQPGESSEKVASRLTELNITDGNGVLKLLFEKGLDRKLKAGRFQLKEGSKPEEIIAQLLK